MSEDLHEVYAVRYGHHKRRSSANFIGGDPHDVLQPLDYFVWAIVGPSGTIIVDTGFDEAMGQKRDREMHAMPEWEELRSLASASRLPEPTLLPPDGVEIYWRIGKKQRISIIENLSSRRQRVELHRSMNDLLSGERKTSIDLPSYGVSVLGEPKP